MKRAVTTSDISSVDCIDMSIPPDPKPFTTALENAMQGRGVTQMDLSRLTGIAVGRVNNYVYGPFSPITALHY
jgi:hypothetical protein